MLNLKPPEGVPQGVLELERSLLGRLAAAHRDSRPGVPDLQARISSYELAARMQLSATDALDLSHESEATREMYGLNDELTSSYGRRCLMARRLVERGVRMVQIYCESQIWDNHTDLEEGLNYCCGKTDKPVGALLSNPAFAATLRAIAEHGPDAFYTGAIAQDVVAAVTHAPVSATIHMSG